MQSRLSRRQFGRIALRAGAGLALVGAIDGFVIEPHFRVVGERVNITLSRLPLEFDGFRIAQLTDIHFGPNIGRRHVERCLEVTRAFNPDLIVLTGDFVGHPLGKGYGPEGARYAEPCSDVLVGGLKNVPQMAILGNHDHWNGPEIVRGALAERGISVLRNSSAAIERGKKRLWIAGIDDALAAKADLQATLEKIPSGEATILLAHEPDYADYASHFPVDLQISGHSHGGQVRVPGIGPLILPRMARKYHTGHYRVRNMQLYTSRGVGVINPPVRFNCPPEVTLITLKAKTI